MNKFSITAILAFVVLLGGAVAAWDIIRPFPTRDEHEQVAGRSCKNELALLFGEQRDIERRLQEAESGNNSKWTQTLREQLRQVMERITFTKKQCGYS